MTSTRNNIFLSCTKGKHHISKKIGDEWKRGYQIGNTKIDKRGNSPFFYFFPLVPYEMKKEKLFKWAQILWGFRKSQMKHLLKILPVYLKNWWIPSFIHLCNSHLVSSFKFFISLNIWQSPLNVKCIFFIRKYKQT